MIEKVNPMHPDKIADRIAGAIVDKAYELEENPKIAVEVLIGHGICTVIAESSVDISTDFVYETVKRISGVDCELNFKLVPQDENLAKNQDVKIRCGDNGIFKGMPLTEEQKFLSGFARKIYEYYPYDGKYVFSDSSEEFEHKITVCQSNAEEANLDMIVASLLDTNKHLDDIEVVINPLGFWTGGVNVDSGATNRKLGSDMADGVTGGGLHGKDLSKADVSLNIYAFLKAMTSGKPVELSCSIGDEYVDGLEYGAIVEIARAYIKSVGGFEKFAEWGLF